MDKIMLNIFPCANIPFFALHDIILYFLLSDAIRILYQEGK